MFDGICMKPVAGSGGRPTWLRTARCAGLILAACALLAVTGCLSMAKPSRGVREEAFARAAKDLAAHRSELQKVTFLVYASDSPTAFDFASHGDKIDMHFESRELFSGLATGISSDGYLLTAAHVVKAHCYVAGWMGGQQIVAPARVVYQESGGEFGEDLAILHVDEPLDSHIQLGKLDPAENEVYAFSCDRDPEVKVIVVAGKILHGPEPTSKADLSVMDMDLPLWIGDSGGAVMTKEGRQVGIFVGISGSRAKLSISRVACLPDMDRVLATIEKDRAGSREKNPSLQSAPAGNGGAP
jgi:hypothetical protein